MIGELRMFPTFAYQAVSTQKCHRVLERRRAPGTKGLTGLRSHDAIWRHGHLRVKNVTLHDVTVQSDVTSHAKRSKNVRSLYDTL